MVNQSIRRITVTGIVTNIRKIKVLDNYSYMIDIDKIDGGTWTVSADEEIVFKCRKNAECVFELAMVFEKDNVYGKEDKKLSRVEAMYIKGKDITEAEYLAQVEADRELLLNDENLIQIKKKKNKEAAMALSIAAVMVIAFAVFSFTLWFKNVDDYRKYEDYIEVEGKIVDTQGSESNDSNIVYVIKYTALDGKEYTAYDEMKRKSGTSQYSYGIGEEVRVIYNPKAYDEGYIGARVIKYDYYVPARYISILPYYILNIIATTSIMFLLAEIIRFASKKVCRFIRMMIPAVLVLMSFWIGIIYNPLFHIGTFLFSVLLIIILYVKAKKLKKNDLKLATIGSNVQEG